MARPIQTAKTEIVYGIRNRTSKEYYTEKSGEGTLENAKTWKTFKTAAKHAREWGSLCRPKPVNDVIEITVKVKTTTRATQVLPLY